MLRLLIRLGAISTLLTVGVLACGSSTTDEGGTSQSDSLTTPAPKCEDTAGHRCRLDSDCCADQFCAVDNGYGYGYGHGYGHFSYCTTKGEVGDYCMADAECRSGSCDQYKCKEADALKE